MLLWVLSLGALASVGDEAMRKMYVKEMHRVCDKLAVARLDDFTAQLSDVVWREAARDLLLVGLWNEVQGWTAFEKQGLWAGLEELDLSIDEGLCSGEEIAYEF